MDDCTCNIIPCSLNNSLYGRWVFIASNYFDIRRKKFFCIFTHFGFDIYFWMLICFDYQLRVSFDCDAILQWRQRGSCLQHIGIVEAEITPQSPYRVVVNPRAAPALFPSSIHKLSHPLLFQYYFIPPAAVRNKPIFTVKLFNII